MFILNKKKFSLKKKIIKKKKLNKKINQLLQGDLGLDKEISKRSKA